MKMWRSSFQKQKAAAHYEPTEAILFLSYYCQENYGQVNQCVLSTVDFELILLVAQLNGI